MIPLLRQLAMGYREKTPDFELADRLFLEIRELVAGTADPAVIQARRHSYTKNAEYLSLHGIDSSRVTTMLESS